MSEFEKLLDSIILEKKRKGVTYDELKDNLNISKPALVRLFSPKQRGTGRIQNAIDVMNYINNKEVN